MATGKPHCRHGCSEYQLITTGTLHEIDFEESCNRKTWEARYPALGLDTPRHFIDCVRLVATGKLEIVKGETSINGINTKSMQGDKIDKYTIVSHPWTEGLEELVNTSKQDLYRNDDGSGSGGQKYFQTISAMLNCRRGSILDALTELAQCTVSLGVRYMWLDSFCLDQCSKESVAFEIGHMYSYYKNAYCTIVNLNGLGEPTNLGEWPTAVARWFSRVWTFQEGVACHELYFLSAPITGILARVVAGLMTKSTCDDSIDQLVTISHTMDSQHGTASHSPKHQAKLYEQVRDRLSCCCCSVQCSVYYTEEDRHNIDERDICMQQMHFRSHLYNWQQVNLIMRWAVLITCKTEVKDAEIAFQALDALVNFSMSRSADLLTLPLEVLEEVCRRNCSEKEDRVLAMLGMLGIGATHTLRSGLSLYDQIKWLCGVAPPEVRHALVVKNSFGMYPSMPGSSWMPDLCRPNVGWLDGNPTFESPIGKWDYDPNTNRVIGKAQIPCSIRIVKVVRKETSEIDEDILNEHMELVLDFQSNFEPDFKSDVSWWTITFSFEPADVDPPKNVVTVEVLFVVDTSKSGEIWGTQVGWVNGHSRGALDISSVVASCNLRNLQDALTNQAFVGLPVMEDMREESPDGYNVAVLLCTGPEEQLCKAGGLIIESEFAPEVARLMWRHRQAYKSLEPVVQIG